MFKSTQRIGLSDSFFTKDMYISNKTEEELKEVFNLQIKSHNKTADVDKQGQKWKNT
jgi:hypothetical protein